MENDGFAAVCDATEKDVEENAVREMVFCEVEEEGRGFDGVLWLRRIAWTAGWKAGMWRIYCSAYIMRSWITLST